MEKNLVLGPILGHLAQIRAIIFLPSGSNSPYISWTPVIMYNIRKK